jgi:hypothetical protein
MTHLLVGVSISEEQSWRQMTRCLVDLLLDADFDDGQHQNFKRARESVVDSQPVLSVDFLGNSRRESKRDGGSTKWQKPK